MLSRPLPHPASRKAVHRVPQTAGTLQRKRDFLRIALDRRRALATGAPAPHEAEPHHAEPKQTQSTRLGHPLRRVDRALCRVQWRLRIQCQIDEYVKEAVDAKFGVSCVAQK